MRSVDKVLHAFAEAWERGERPSVAEALERVPARDRDELAAGLRAWLMLAPTPELSEEARAAVRASPPVRAALAAVEDDVVAHRVATRRAELGLTLDAVADEVLAGAGLPATGRPRAAEFLQRLEDGRLAADRLSRRLVDLLARTLETSAAALVPAPPGWEGASLTLFRAEDGAGAELEADLDALARAAFAQDVEPLDEIERLFLGGPDA